MASELTVELFDLSDMTTPVTGVDLSDADSKSFQDVKNDVGAGSVTLPNDHPDYASVTPGRVLRFFLDGTALGQTLIEQRDKTSVDPDAERQEVTVFSGRNLAASFELVETYPEGGVNNVASDVTEGFDTRFFHWGSYLFDEGGAWSSAVQLFRQDQSPPLAPPSGFSGAPEGWPPQLLGAYWIWSQAISGSSVPTGTSYFRKEFNVASSGLYALFYAGNDQFEIFLDGIKLDAYTEQGPGGWKQTRVRYLVISSGNHLVAMSGTNLSVPGASSSIAGVIFGIVPVNDDGTLGSAVTFTDNTWSANGYSALDTGMTAGRKLRFLVEEAQARGLLTGLVLDFTDSLDSSGDAWTVTETSIKVGSTLLEVLEQLAEADVDWRMSSTDYKLRVWNKGGLAGSSGLSLTSTNITKLVHTANTKVRNALLVRHSDGYREVTDATSITANGRGEAFLELGSTNSAAEIDRVAGANLDDLGRELVTTEIAYEDTTATLRPKLELDLFKTVTVPGLDASTDVLPINAFTVSDGDNGFPVFDLTVGDVRESPEKTQQRALRRLAGSINGRSRSVAPVVPHRPTLLPPLVETQSWGGTGTPTTDKTPPWFPHYSHRTLRVTVGRDAGTSAMTVTIYKNGSSVGTITTGATATAAFAYFTSTVTGGTDYLQAAVTTAGTGTTNPSVVVEAI